MSKTTYTRKDYTEAIGELAIAEKYHKPLSNTDCQRLAETVIQVITENLQRGVSVPIRHAGTLRVNRKAAREGVRNPKTGDIYSLAARTTVTLTRRSAEYRTSYSDMIETVAITLMIPNSLARIAINAFIKMVHKVKRTPDTRFEIRGLGVFRNMPSKARLARNPKTGAKVAVPAGTKLHFRYSTVLFN